MCEIYLYVQDMDIILFFYVRDSLYVRDLCVGGGGEREKCTHIFV